MKKPQSLIWSIFLCLITYGCASGPEITKLMHVWKYDKYSGMYLEKVMIVGKPKSDANRIRYEDHMAGELAKRKVEAISSHRVIPEMKDLNRENIKQAAVVSGEKTVLVSRVVGIDEKNVLFKQSANQQIVATPHGMYMRTFVEPGHVEKFTKVRLETGLFDVESEELFWAASSAIINPETADEAIEDFSKALIEQLVKDGFIP